MITVLVIGVVWYTVGALGKAAPTAADREIATGHALGQAKQALLAYAAQYAARSTTIEPGQMPCPEFLSSIGTNNQGQAGTSCSNSSPTVGRLPWETLGVDEIRDGYGEPIWYVLSPGFRSAPINFGTLGQLTYNGNPNAAVALLIAPGPALNTLSDPATPSAGCSKVNQQVSTRNTASLNPQNFLECGNDTGNNTVLGNSQWTNDRVVAITAAEWAQTIAGPVADRLQRQVAPVLASWDQTELSVRGKSWGSTYGLPYMPFASSFSDPATNDYCGNAGAPPMREGLPPTASESSGTCATNWTGSVSLLLGLLNLGCSNSGTELVCTFLNLFGVAPFSARVTATAQNVANSFRGTIVASDVWVSGGGSYSFALSSFSATTGAASVTVDASWPLLGLFSFVQVHIPNLPDAVFMADSSQPSYAATAWFLNNDWQRFAYYAVGSGVTLSPTSVCAAPGDGGCLTLDGMPASNGSASDKKLVLALMGPGPVGAQTQPSNNPANYLESHASGSTIYTAATVTSAFNDRFAACPFQQTPASGGPIAICN
ncbi:MAG: hypothetical protein WCA17_12345 [Burkholderiales bacterium]